MFTPVYMIAGAAAFCAFAALQFRTLKNGLSKSVKAMPAIISLTMLFICLMLYAGAFGESKAMLGFKANELYGLAFGMVSLCAIIGDIVALIVFKMTYKKPGITKKKKK